MKTAVMIQEVREGDRINGKPVVEILQRFDVMVRQNFARLVLAGREVVSGCFGDRVEIER